MSSPAEIESMARDLEAFAHGVMGRCKTQEQRAAIGRLILVLAEVREDAQRRMS